MAGSDFQTGARVMGMPILGAGGLIPQTFGKYIFVDSNTGVNGNSGETFSEAMATIDAAIGRCTANTGDVIIVAEGHSESISGAAAIAADVAGVKIVGLGVGNSRPLITLHTTATTIAISAANVMFRNIRIATDVDAVVKVFNITAAGATLDAVDFVETAACAALQFVLTTVAADDLTIQNCSWVQSQTAATALMKWIELVGADRAKIRNNYANLKGFATSNPANGVIVGSGTASLDVEIMWNRMIILNSTGNIAVSMLANSTGFVGYNSAGSSKTAQAGTFALANCYGAENYATNAVNTNGTIDPAADT
jgi:hypothetical protein